MPSYPKCSRVEIRTYLVDEYEGGRDYELTAFMGGSTVGSMDLSTQELEGRPILGVEYAKVLTPRCGIGTKLYERALQLACENGIPLASDTARTVASEGFWAKQTTKGRAHCYLGDRPGRRLRHTPGGFDTEGTWPCYRYAMREACPRKLDLSGRRRR
jgi:hypothetical protein